MLANKADFRLLKKTIEHNNLLFKPFAAYCLLANSGILPSNEDATKAP